MTRYFLLFLFSSNVAMANDYYTVVEKISDNIEIRKYDAAVVAKVNIDEKKSEKDLFKILFNFISGNNAQQKKIPMTVPVLEAVPNIIKKSMFFIMPKTFTVQTTPKPNNSDVIIEQLPFKKVAVITFSGRSILANFNYYDKKLVAKLKELGIKINLSDRILAYYNSPWTLPFLKTNEVIYRVE